jgi:hypothetical protein
MQTTEETASWLIPTIVGILGSGVGIWFGLWLKGRHHHNYIEIEKLKDKRTQDDFAQKQHHHEESLAAQKKAPRLKPELTLLNGKDTHLFNVYRGEGWTLNPLKCQVTAFIRDKRYQYASDPDKYGNGSTAQKDKDDLKTFSRGADKRKRIITNPQTNPARMLENGSISVLNNVPNDLRNEFQNIPCWRERGVTLRDLAFEGTLHFDTMEEPFECQVPIPPQDQ